METGCHSLHRLKHRAVIALIAVFSLLFYIICMYTHNYHRILMTVGILKNFEQEVQQETLYELFTGSINIEDGKYVLMKNGYQFSGQLFLFFDTFSILISISYLIIIVVLLKVYKKTEENKTREIELELNYLKTGIESFLFGGKVDRNDSYKECNYLLDRLEKRVYDENKSNENELFKRIAFHQNIIHQINTPLNTIKILIEYLYEQEKIEKSYLDNMNYAIEKASDLARIYLRSSKLDIGKVIYQFEETELNELIEDVCHSLNIYANYHQTRIINKCSNLKIYVDSLWVKEAIENIVKNFIENSVNSNIIIISSIAVQDKIFIFIEDNKRTSLEKLNEINFDRFESSKSGIGIGLHLSQQIIKAHLGEVTVGKGPKGGIRFTIELLNKSQKSKVKLER